MKTKNVEHILYVYMRGMGVTPHLKIQKRDYKSLKSEHMSGCRHQHLYKHRSLPSHLDSYWKSLNSRIPQKPKKGTKHSMPSDSIKIKMAVYHCSTYREMQTCKFCSSTNVVYCSRWMCRACKVNLCLLDTEIALNLTNSSSRRYDQ